MRLINQAFQSIFSLTTLAGTPATIQCGGTSLVTKEWAAIIEPSPIVTPLRTILFSPNQT